MLSEEVLYLSVRELGERIRARKLSPVELAESYLERSERLGPRLNAYASITRELALQQAHTAEKEIASGHIRGPLHGIPYAAKDLVAVKGYPTTWGARPYADQKFDYNATIIERLNNAGAVLIGKAAMIELAGGLGYEHGAASLTGPCKNPWKTDCWTCGSSSGSGAVVAAGLAPWAIGSDTRGSIICPSSWCGVSGMRPSFGRVSRHGSMAIAWTMDKLGPMCRTAEDCGIVLSVIAGHDPKDFASAENSAFVFPDPKRRSGSLRVGRLTNVWNKLDDGLQKSLDDALAVMEKNGAKVTDANMPDGPFEEVSELTILIEAASSFHNLIESGRCAQLHDALGQINGYPSQEIAATDYLHIQRARTFLQAQVDKLFDDFDVLATAGESSAAVPLSEPPEEENTDEAMESRAPDGVSSLCGLPALAVPCGFNKDHLPFSIQFIGRAMNDHAVIEAARLYQAHTDWHRQHPKLDS